MAYQKIVESSKTIGRYYKNRRLFILRECSICKEVREIRYDHYSNTHIKMGKEVRCRLCRGIKYNGHATYNGYVTRNYRSYPRKYWGILSVMCKKNNQIKEHRANLAISINRPLTETEIVHHKNGIRNDNNITNLELCIIRQPMGQRVYDIIEENRRLHEIIKKHKICL